MRDSGSAHPYVPNSSPRIIAEMLSAMEVRSVDELVRDVPKHLRLNRELNLPPALVSEQDLRRHIEEILSKNKTTKEYLNFLGGGCWQHSVPAVCNAIFGRSEFNSAYAGDTYADLGKCQAYFEFQSLMSELVEMDLVSFPVYDWATAAAFALRMATRLTGRSEVLVPRTTSPERLSVIMNFCKSTRDERTIVVKRVGYDKKTGILDVDELRRSISSRTAAVYLENPSYLGLIEPRSAEIGEIAHRAGAQFVVGVDPTSLGVLASPSSYGCDIACGEMQPLGLPMSYGGTTGGFIASPDSPEYVAEYPTYLYSIAPTIEEGKFGFGRSTHERTLFRSREQGNDFIGSSTGLWAIVNAVYLSLMGPNGMRELGEAILRKSHYAAKLLSEVDGLEVKFGDNFFKEFVVEFKRARQSVKEVNRGLLSYRIFGGNDLSKEFPELGASALYCVTEVHTREDIEKLAAALRELTAA